MPDSKEHEVMRELLATMAYLDVMAQLAGQVFLDPRVLVETLVYLVLTVNQVSKENAVLMVDQAYLDVKDLLVLLD